MDAVAALARRFSLCEEERGGSVTVAAGWQEGENASCCSGEESENLLPAGPRGDGEAREPGVLGEDSPLSLLLGVYKEAAANS